MEEKKYTNNTQRQAELYYQFRLRLPKDKESEIKEAAQAEGKTINEYILDCITEHELNNSPENAEKISAVQSLESAISILKEIKMKLK